MELPVLERGCCGICDLRTCVKVQAWLNMIAATISIIVTSVYISLIQDVTKDNHDQDVQDVVSVAYALLSIIIIMAIVSLILAILLLRGVQTENPGLILPYLIAAAVVMTIDFAINIAAISMGTVSIGQVIYQLFWQCGFQAYLWLHVYSLYKVMGSPRGTYTA